MAEYFFIEAASVHIYSPRTGPSSNHPSHERATEEPTLPTFLSPSLSLISPRGAFIVVSSHNTRTVTTPADAFPTARASIGH